MAKLLQESRTDLDAFFVDSQAVSAEEGGAFELPLSVPFEEFAYQVEGRLQLLPLNSIPLHWELPLPHSYVAVDVERALWTREPRLDLLVQRLHQLGCARVRPRSLTIYALLASANPEVDDVVVVPFDLYTENEDEDVVDPQAEVDIARDVADHWLFADGERRECKLKRLLA